MNRRDFIKTAALVPAAAAVSVLPQFSLSAFAAAAKWRVFEVTTKVEVLKPEGTTRAWLPLPLVADTDYQKNLGSTWSIEGGTAATATDGKYGAEFIAAEWRQGRLHRAGLHPLHDDVFSLGKNESREENHH